MTYIKDKISEIDEAFAALVSRDCEGNTAIKMAFHGLCREQWVQRANAVLLHEDNAERKPVVYDDSKDIQLIHVHLSTTPASNIQFGARQKTALNYTIKLIVVSKLDNMFERCIKALNHVDDIVFMSSNNQVENIMKKELKTIIDNNKNYPPELYAFSVTYQVSSVV